jgi:arsenate reductase-like glutaredoxin family protein
VIANKVTMDGAAALAAISAKGITKIVSAKGAKIDTLEMKSATPEEILALVMGPTGNLRAPSAVVGKTLVVGFNSEVYEEVLG